jgi:type IV secretory pathway VirB2 component (pilin)
VKEKTKNAQSSSGPYGPPHPWLRQLRRTKKMKKLWNIIILAILLTITEQGLASRLEEAAQRGQSLIISIGQITAVIGIVIGGIALSIGMANLGRMILMSGVFGAAATFGGPAIIDLLKEIFR